MSRYFVYKNLHNGKWSIKDASTNLVVGHCDGVILWDVEFKVSQAGRRRVLRDKAKNVHAGVVGRIAAMAGFTSFKERSVDICWDHEPSFVHINKPFTYNPYKYSSFVDNRTGEPLTTSTWALLSNSGLTTYL